MSQKTHETLSPELVKWIGNDKTITEFSYQDIISYRDMLLEDDQASKKTLESVCKKQYCQEYKKDTCGNFYREYIAFAYIQE